LSGALTRFQLRPSPVLAAALVLAHGAAGASAFFSLGGFPGALLGLALLALGIAAAWSRALLRSPGSLRALEVEGEAVTLELATGERFQADIAPRRYVARWLVTLPVTRPRKRTLLVTSDMLGEPAFRLLRLWALWGRLPALR
jgi:hypothetical protein